MITANDIKTRGVKAIEEGLKEEDRLSISVRGEVRYVVLTAEAYEQLRLAELEVAYQAAVKDVEQGKFTAETAEEHMDRLWKKPRKKSVRK
jgi:hypothetical protein